MRRLDEALTILAGRGKVRGADQLLMTLDSELSGEPLVAVTEHERRAAMVSTKMPPVEDPKRRRLPSPAIGLAAFAVIVLTAGLLIWLLPGGGGEIAAEPTTTTGAVTTTQTVTTTEAVTTAKAVEKTPAATVDDLVHELYAALNAKDDEAFWALVTDDSHHIVYYVHVGFGRTIDEFDNIDFALSTDGGWDGIEVLGDPIVSGNTVTVPLRYNYPDEVDTGFDVLLLEPAGAGGLLVAGAVTIYADPAEPVADAAEVKDLAEANVAAWNADDAEGVLATYNTNAMLWDDLTTHDTYTGAALEQFIADNLWFDVELTGEPVISGPFAAVPNRLVTPTDTSEGVSIFRISDGKFALHGFQQ